MINKYENSFKVTFFVCKFDKNNKQTFVLVSQNEIKATYYV